MRYLLPTVAVIGFVAGARRADACDFPVRSEFPTQQAVRVTGVVLGYEPIATTTVKNVVHEPAPLQLPDTVAGVRIAIREIISGPVSAREAVVVPLAYGADCRTFLHPLSPEFRAPMERSYPIGSLLAIVGRPAGSPAAAIIVETNRGEFAVQTPNTLQRTKEGDLDFRTLDRRRSLGVVGRFEFERSLLTVSRNPATRYERLRNLAYAPEWQYLPDGRQRYTQLISDSRLTQRQRNELLTTFDRAQAR